VEANKNILKKVYWITDAVHLDRHISIYLFQKILISYSYRMETDAVSEMLHSLGFRIPDDGQSLEPQ
jgi:hypothetical protein